MKNKLLVSLLMMICWVIAIVFWLYSIKYLINNSQDSFWNSVVISFVFSFLAKKLLKIRKELDIKLS